MVSVEKAREIVKNYNSSEEIFVSKDSFGNVIMYFGADFDQKEEYLKGYLQATDITNMTHKQIIKEIEKYEEEINDMESEQYEQL